MFDTAEDEWVVSVQHIPDVENGSSDGENGDEDDGAVDEGPQDDGSEDGGRAERVNVSFSHGRELGPLLAP